MQHAGRPVVATSRHGQAPGRSRSTGRAETHQAVRDDGEPAPRPCTVIGGLEAGPIGVASAEPARYERRAFPTAISAISGGRLQFCEPVMGNANVGTMLPRDGHSALDLDLIGKRALIR